MDKIESFQKDHLTLEPGLYMQKCNRNILTFDLRFIKPNTGVIPIEAIHTIEHLFATWLKISNNELRDIMISFNPGGCQTMFYLEIFDDLSTTECDLAPILIKCINDCLKAVEVPGATKEECGNYESHDLHLAKYWLTIYKEILEKDYV